MTVSSSITVQAEALVVAVTELLAAVGVPPGEARVVATSLVDADLEGVASHGVLLVPLYVDRIRHGSVSPVHRSEVVVDRGATVVVDGHHSLGQLTADFAMGAALTKAKAQGVGVAAVRHAFHFGMARRYALQAAAEGCVGIAMCNTRPLMPPPGGAQRLVGNNPLAIALPTGGEIPLVLDIAMSAAAMGRIRMAEQAGRPIPDSWATDAEGLPTTDPAAAIAGMLLPAAGHKGFGLAFMIDLMCGLLSGGAWGEGVQPLYGDPSVPYDCSFLLAAIDVAHFRPPADFAREAAAAAERIRASRPAPGVERVYAPGEPEWLRRRAANGVVTLDESLRASLIACGASVGVDVSRYLNQED